MIIMTTFDDRHDGALCDIRRTLDAVVRDTCPRISQGLIRVVLVPFVPCMSLSSRPILSNESVIPAIFGIWKY